MVINTLYRNAASAPEKEVVSSFTFSGDLIRDALKNIYNKKFHPMTDIEENMFDAVWKTLNLATDKGFGARPADDPDQDFIREIKHNNAVFAAFKVHRAQNDMARLLLDKNGNLKPFEKWVEEVMPIADHQMLHWLRTEYDTAVIRAHRAADWRQAEREKDVLPNLEWVPSTSVHPGEDHRVFWGTIRPIDDPFWNVHRPGDRWNCKCGLRSTDKPVTDTPSGGKESDPAPGLENNPGRDAKLFSDNHPYQKEAYPGAKEAVDKLMKRIDRKDDYTELQTAAGRLRIHVGHGKGERQENIRVASYFTDKYGYEIDLLPKDDDKPCADAYNRTLERKEEYKVNTRPTANAIDTAIRSAKRQADHIVLWIDSGIDLELLPAIIRNRVKREENIKSITVVVNGKDKTLTRHEILNNKIQLADLK